MADYKYPANVGEDVFQAFILFQEWERQDRNSSRPTNTYALYMPERLVNPNTVSWDAEKLGVVAGLGTELMNGQISTGTALSNVYQAGATRAKFNIASSIAQKMGSSASAETLMGATLQKIPNPYLTMLFRGVDFRTFEFTFKLYPHSQQDTITIRDMIKSLRMASLPPGKGGSGDYLLGYPNEFTIEYHYGDIINPWLNKFKRCVLVGIDTDYTGSGMWSMTRDGFPAEITLNLRFTEIEIVLRDDVNEGY
jgi:hypothetical protein